jgi:hypothetical protein
LGLGLTVPLRKNPVVRRPKEEIAGGLNSKGGYGSQRAVKPMMILNKMYALPNAEQTVSL